MPLTKPTLVTTKPCKNSSTTIRSTPQFRWQAITWPYPHKSRQWSPDGGPPRESLPPNQLSVHGRYGVEGSSHLGFQDQPTQARRVSQKCGGISPNDPVYVAPALLAGGGGRSGVGVFAFPLVVNFGCARRRIRHAAPSRLTSSRLRRAVLLSW